MVAGVKVLGKQPIIHGDGRQRYKEVLERVRLVLRQQCHEFAPWITYTIPAALS